MLTCQNGNSRRGRCNGPYEKVHPQVWGQVTDPAVKRNLEFLICYHHVDQGETLQDFPCRRGCGLLDRHGSRYPRWVCLHLSLCLRESRPRPGLSVQHGPRHEYKPLHWFRYFFLFILIQGINSSEVFLVRTNNKRKKRKRDRHFQRHSLSQTPALSTSKSLPVPKPPCPLPYPSRMSCR